MALGIRRNKQIKHMYISNYHDKVNPPHRDIPEASNASFEHFGAGQDIVHSFVLACLRCQNPVKSPYAGRMKRKQNAK